MSEQDLQRFYAKVVVDRVTGCWNWTGSKTKNGYALMYLANLGAREMHKVAYEHFVGPVPEGLVLGHKTQKDKCVCWEHVRPITQLQNMREARGQEDGYCGRCRNTLSGTNVYRNSRGYDECKTCRGKRLNEYWTARGQPHRYNDWATRYTT